MNPNLVNDIPFVFNRTSGIQRSRMARPVWRDWTGLWLAARSFLRTRTDSLFGALEGTDG